MITVIDIEEEQTHHQDAAQMIQDFRAEMQMSERDWYKFCLRYSSRNISTVILFFEDMYDKVPYGFSKFLRGEMSTRVQKQLANA